MPRSCMVVHEYYPRDFRVRRQARALAAAGWQVDIVCLRRPGQPARERIDGLDVYRLPVRRHRGAPIAAYLAEYSAFASLATAWLAARPGRYRVCHLHAPPDWLVFAVWPQRLAGARVVLDIHDLTPELYTSRFRGRGGRLAHQGMRLAEQASCAFADTVVTVTGAFRDILLARGVDADKLYIVRNCPDPVLFDRKLRRRRSRRRAVRIIHHGTLVRRYGPDLLIEAFARVAGRLPAGSRLDIYGEGDARRDLQRLVSRHGLEGMVELHGEVEQEQVARALAEADICVVPNRSDEFTELLLPTKLLEAIHMGVATIASRTRVIEQEVGQGVLLVEPGDVAELTRALLRLGSDGRARARYTARARGLRRRFDWEVEKAGLVELYRRLSAGCQH